MRKKKKTGRNNLEEALRKSFSEYHRQIPDSGKEILFGKDYDDDMRDLIQRSKHSRSVCFSVCKSRAAGIAAAFWVVFICTMTVTAVRLPVVSFIANVFENHIEIFFRYDDVSNAPETIETAYTLGFVPEGYEITSQLFEKNCVILIWKNQNNCVIEFRQYILDGKTTIDNQEIEFYYYDIDGLQILANEKYGMKVYFWNTKEYQFRLYIEDDGISADEGIELIRSVASYK